MAATAQHFLPFRPTMGLLTTVAELPHNYKIRYITPESPLDLSVKPDTIVAAAVPMTPPCSPVPPKKRYREEDTSVEVRSTSTDLEPGEKYVKTEVTLTIQKQRTPNKPIKSDTNPRTSKVHPASAPKERKHKAVRKLKFDEKKSSPVSGTIIRQLEEIDENVVHESGDIDPQYNIVEVTEEAKAEIAAIPNVIGSYACKLCRNEFEDVFGLARHRCSCIVLLEYRCPECGKRFNCPANLASHRRWHKPKEEVLRKQQENTESGQQFRCDDCGKFFKRQAYLRKHMATHKSKDTSGAAVQKVPKHSESSGSYRSENSNSSSEDVENQIFEEFTFALKGDSDSEHSRSSFASNGPKNFRMFDGAFTEDENLAAAALAHLRNGPSVIRHTTTMAV